MVQIAAMTLSKSLTTHKQFKIKTIKYSKLKINKHENITFISIPKYYNHKTVEILIEETDQLKNPRICSTKLPTIS